MKTLNQKEQEILNCIKNNIISKGYPPSVREIGQAVGLKSSSTVYNYLCKLEQKGYLKRDQAKPRAIEILGDTGYTAKDITLVPILGQVAAGLPLLAVENYEEMFPLPNHFFNGSGNCFMLRVQGDSMIDVGIFEGDLVVVRQQPDAENGDIVVALIEDEATVKTFYKEQDHVRLQPENQRLEPIIVQDVTILGKVTGLIRRF